MKTEKFSFTVSIPSVLVTNTVLFYQRVKRWIYWLNPFRCSECGVKMKFARFDFNWTHPSGTKVMVHNHGKEILCGHCLSKRIVAEFSRGVENNTDDDYDAIAIRTCDCCGGMTPTSRLFSSERCDIRFGTSWWNGFYLCEDCLCDTVELGNHRSGFLQYYDGKVYEVNARGVWFNV